MGRVWKMGSEWKLGENNKSGAGRRWEKEALAEKTGRV